MSGNFDFSYLSVMVDMAGCPNRCRHCWLGAHRNGNLSVADFRAIADEFKRWRDDNGRGIDEWSFFSWWREPDYRDDYRELWELEQELSSPGRAMRFELLSTWRLGRDESYAKWAATLAPKACQITFFGMEENTDWGIRRKGAFRDQLLATERLLAAGIAPRWQLFITKRCLGEIDEFLRLIKELDLHKRTEAIGQKFEFFFGSISPEGGGYDLEDIRVEQSDLQYIPCDLIALSRDGLNFLGQPESVLLTKLLNDHNPPNMDVDIMSLSVNAGYDVYPNIAEPTEWWRLGNLKTDSVKAIMRALIEGTTPAMTANKTVPISELAKRYGNGNSQKLYSRDSLICRFMHEWGVAYLATSRH